MIDAVNMSTVRTHNTLTIITCSCTFCHGRVMFCNSVSIITHTDMLVMCNHRRMMMVVKGMVNPSGSREGSGRESYMIDRVLEEYVK